MDNLVVKYAPDLPAVLHERVGLVGRTGSGKCYSPFTLGVQTVSFHFSLFSTLGMSTLATALLRFVDPTDGRSILDGIDVTKIGFYDLRSRVVR